MANYRFTVIIEKEGEQFVALCPELDIASQGSSVSEAKTNLKEAVELFLECADKQEIELRNKEDLYITQMELAVA